METARGIVKAARRFQSSPAIFDSLMYVLIINTKFDDHLWSFKQLWYPFGYLSLNLCHGQALALFVPC